MTKLIAKIQGSVLEKKQSLVYLMSFFLVTVFLGFVFFSFLFWGGFPIKPNHLGMGKRKQACAHFPGFLKRPRSAL